MEIIQSQTPGDRTETVFNSRHPENGRHRSSFVLASPTSSLESTLASAGPDEGDSRQSLRLRKDPTG